MLNAVWVAVIVAAAFFVVGVCAAVYVMAKAARLMSQATGAVATLREHQEALIERASTTIDRANEQLVKTDAITASMDEVTANMAELTGRMTALAPLARVIAASAGSPAAKVAALAYGVNRALWMRLAGAQRRITAPGGAGRGGAVPGPRDEGTPAPGGARLAAGRPGRPARRGGVMIGRLFWLVLGAVLGVAGYRRLTAFARSVSPAGRARALGRFTADVREGMQLYMERQPGDRPSTLEGQQGRRELPGPAAGRGPGG